MRQNSFHYEIKALTKKVVGVCRSFDHRVDEVQLILTDHVYMRSFMMHGSPHH